jgi:hypothetical protein
MLGVREDLRLRLAGWFRHNGQYDGSNSGPILPVVSRGVLHLESVP